jgi:hypothetical protein
MDIHADSGVTVPVLFGLDKNAIHVPTRDNKLLKFS